MHQSNCKNGRSRANHCEKVYQSYFPIRLIIAKALALLPLLKCISGNNAQAHMRLVERAKLPLTRRRCSSYGTRVLCIFVLYCILRYSLSEISSAWMVYVPSTLLYSWRGLYIKTRHSVYDHEYAAHFASQSQFFICNRGQCGTQRNKFTRRRGSQKLRSDREPVSPFASPHPATARVSRTQPVPRRDGEQHGRALPIAESCTKRNRLRPRGPGKPPGGP